MSRVVVEADGGSRGNPGPAGYGAVVLGPEGDVLAERWEFLGVQTNNVAEYRGLLAGLGAALDLGATEVHVRMDSRLVVEQVQGHWKVKNAGLAPLVREAQELLARFGEHTVEWIPRAQNGRADALANRAMDEAAAPAPAPVPSWVPSGSATRLLLVRHGATEHSPARRLSGRNELPLSPDGRSQAAALAARLSDAGIEVVVSSPLLRARQTAQAVADSLRLPVETVEDLTETDFGAWEGRSAAEAAESHPEQWAAWSGDPRVPAPGGESLAQVAERALRAQEQILAAHPGRTVAVVSHVTPIKALLVRALDAPLSSMFRVFLDTASVSRVDLAPDGRATVRSVNVTS